MNEEIINILKNKNLKVTNNRILILKEFLKNKKPISANDIYISIHKKSPEIAITTIYRNIKKLEDENVIKVATQNLDGTYFYEILKENNPHTHYIICEKCNKMQEIDTCILKQQDELISKKTGFKVLYHKLQYIGLCNKCSKKKK